MVRGVLSIVRKYGENLTKSVQRDFDDIIDEYGARHLIKINKSERTYKYAGRTIELFGCDDAQKMRWPRRDILYCNEANELSPEEFFQLQIRTRYKIFLDFNPDDEDVWINRDLEQERAAKENDVEVIVSTYKDNPFLAKSIVQEIERLAERDPTYWRVYWLGQYGKLEWLIFDEWEEIDEVPKDAILVAYGQDFGYTNDPSAMVWIYKYDGCIILDEKIYSSGLTNVYIRPEEKESSLVWLYEELWIGKEDEIFADSSEPKSIGEIWNFGYNIHPVEKGADSVRFGISLMKQYKIKVTRRSVNLKKERRKYVWKKNRNGESLSEPIDKFNHALDAVRYVFMMRLRIEIEEPERKLHFI